jgi:hypothetical protein
MEKTSSASKAKKEESKKLKDEEKLKKEQEISTSIKDADNAFKEVKIKRDNLVEKFATVMKSVLAIWGKNVKNEKIAEDLYLTTSRMVEYALGEKELINFTDNLNSDEKAFLLRFFYTFYDRFSKKLNCLTLKPNKIYATHQTIIEKEGVGIVGRALFSIQK